MRSWLVTKEQLIYLYLVLTSPSLAQIKKKKTVQEKQGNQAADQPLLSSESGHFPAYPTDFPPLL